MGKRLGSIYEPGERLGAWINHRSNIEQEFVIARYIPRRTRIRCAACVRLRKQTLIFVAKVKDGSVPRANAD